MQQTQKGFTLIELMIVIAIVGILAAIAVPAYSKYTLKAKVTAALSLASPIKFSVVEYFNTNGDWPANNTTLGLGANDGSGITSDTVASISVADNIITITFNSNAGSDIAGNNFTLTAPSNPQNGVISWTCSSAGSNGISADYAPSGCDFSGS